MSKSKTAPELKITAREGKTREQDMAWVLLDPTIRAGRFLALENKNYPDVDVTAFVHEMQQHAAAVQRNDLSGGEAMLTAQAHALDSLFYSMADRSAENSKEGYLGAAETYMKLGLRAQSQCRSTWEAIAEIKNPRQVAFVKQANMGHNVQVNNGGGEIAQPSRVRENEITPNKLSGIGNELLPDTSASQAESRIGTPVGTMDKVHRTEIDGR